MKTSKTTIVVCMDCANHAVLHKIINEKGTRTRCSFCGKNAICCNAAILSKFIDRCIRNRFIVYANKGDTSRNAGRTTADILDEWESEFFEASNYRFLDYISISIHASRWLDPLFYSPQSPLIFLNKEWEKFKNEVSIKEPSVADMAKLDFIKILKKFIERTTMISTLPRHTRIFRARIHSKTELYTKAFDLGTPPQDRSANNRYSPRGVPAFYASSHYTTAWKEIIQGANKDDAITMGLWQTLEPIRILDFAHEIIYPSLFNPNHLIRSCTTRFLRELIMDARHPIFLKDPHKEYVPTQMICKYFIDALHIEGVMYMSIHHDYPWIMEESTRGINYALFIPRCKCGDTPDFKKYSLHLLKPVRADLSCEMVTLKRLKKRVQNNAGSIYNGFHQYEIMAKSINKNKKMSKYYSTDAK